MLLRPINCRFIIVIIIISVPSVPILRNDPRNKSGVMPPWSGKPFSFWMLNGNSKFARSSYFANWRVKLQTGPTPYTPPPIKKSSDLHLSQEQFLAKVEMWLVWRSGYGVRHINEVKLRRARLVLGLVTTFGGSTIPVFIQAHSAWLSPVVGVMSTGYNFCHLWEETAPPKLRPYGVL